MLAKTAGVKHLVVLVNKMDDPTVNWAEERLVLLLGNDFDQFHLLSKTSIY